MGADPSVTNRALAETLFRAAKDLLASGNVAEACPKFAESYQLDPALGTLLNLALCHEKEGKVATAWVEFTDAEGQAENANQTEREVLAHRHAQALAGSLSYVTVNVPKGGSASPPEVRIDGTALARAGWGTPVPMDPGEHHVEAASPGKKTWESPLVVAAGPSRATIEIPVLEDAPAPTPVLASPAAESHVSEPREASTVETAKKAPAAEHGKALPTERALGLVLGGAGIVALGAGAFFGFEALGRKHDRDAVCDADHRCAPGSNGVALDQEARNAATISTVATLGGLALTGAGAVLLLLPLEPIDRSTLREMITIASPSVRSAKIEVLPRTMLTSWPLRKRGWATDVTMIRSASAATIPKARSR